jgi:hypothetical protein
MPITDHAKERGHRLDAASLSGPRTAFIASVLAVASIWAFGYAASRADLALPFAVTAMFAAAAVFALVARWQRHAAGNDVTYWDVAGALTLIAICMSALIYPEQMMRVVGVDREN